VTVTLRVEIIDGGPGAGGSRAIGSRKPVTRFAQGAVTVPTPGSSSASPLVRRFSAVMKIPEHMYHSPDNSCNIMFRLPFACSHHVFDKNFVCSCTGNGGCGRSKP